MVPDKFNMVDMEGIDLLAVQGETIPGLYNKLVESIAQCRYQCVYNWAFNGVLIPPTYVEMEERSDGVWINEGVMVDEEDVVHISSIEPEPPTPIEPVIEPLSVTANGIYTVPSGTDGYNPVDVNVSSIAPVIQSLSVTENGTYNPPSGVDGYAPITVNVGGSSEVSKNASDIVGGYVAGGIWNASGNDARTDEYAVQANKMYVLCVGPTFGTRFRCMFTTQEVSENPTISVTGTAIGADISNPNVNNCTKAFVPTQDGFILIGKDNAYTDGLPSHVFVLN